jgi:RNA polymerase-binding protein DksA
MAMMTGGRTSRRKDTGRRKAAAVRKKTKRGSRLAAGTLRKLRDLLLEKKERIAQNVQTLREHHLHSSSRDASGDLSGYSLHMADMGTDAFDREFGLSVASSEGDLLYRIEQALKRIDEGGYGRCEACGGAIKLTRLKAVPWAALCIRCKKMEEEERGKVT